MKNQFKRVLALLLAVVMILGILPSVFAANNVGPFKDVQDNAWYAPYVKAVYEHGLMQGVSANKFNPEGTSTRAQVATVLYRIAGQPPVGGPATFTDLTADWYANPVAWAQKEGIVNGLSKTKFGPNDNVTREQLVTMIHRYYGNPAGNGDLTAFSDAAKVSNYAKEAFAWAIGEGIINGSNGKLNPQGLATRAQFAKIIWLSIPEPCEHVWDEGVVTKEPTCVASGIKTFTCTKCGEAEKEPIAATGEHELVETITQAPACESYGVKTVTCSVCGASSTESIDPTGHTYGDDDICDVCAYERVTEKVYTLTAALKDGDKVVIYNAGYGKAIVAAMNGYYLAGADMAPVDNTITTNDATVVWTVKVNDDGTYTFLNGENEMGADVTTNDNGTFVNIYVENGHKAKWDLDVCNEATSSYYISNAELEAPKYEKIYLEWYDKKAGFSAYDTGVAKLNEQAFGFQFYAEDATPPQPHEHTYVDGFCTGCGEKDPDYDEPPVPGDEFVRVTELREGAEIIVVCDSRNIALGADYGTSYYNPGVAVEPVDGVIKNSDSTIVWTVGKEGDFYTLSYNGQKLGMGTEFTSMSLGGVNYKWELREAANAGTFYLANLDRDPSQAYYMQWYEAKTYWSGYYNLNDELMALSFYEKGATPIVPCEHTYVDGVCTGCGEKDPNYVPPVDPPVDGEVFTRVNELKEGDEIIIVCDAKAIALSATYGTNYNNGVAVEVVDGKITTSDKTLVWTVGKEGEYYTFSYEGQKIAMGTEFSSMPLGEVNYKWIVTPAENEGTFYVGNPDRDPSKGIYYMEWYESKGYWSAYHKLDDALMALAFYAKGVEDNGGNDDEEEPKPCEHVWDEGTVTKEATCAEVGVMEYACTLCDATKTESIPATGEHTYEEGTCTGCGAKDPNYVPPTPPTPGEATAVDFSSLQDGDVIAIVITANPEMTGKDYVLLNNFGADAYSNAAVFEGTFTESMYWTVKIVDGKVYLVNGEIGLSILDNNNGLRANGEAMAIEMDESGYLKMTDPNGNVRYIGVYDNNGGDVSKVATPNIRSYKNYTNNTKDQTTTIYKIG